jgi:hypothetical protein
VAVLSIQQAEEGAGDEKFQQLFSSSNTKNIQSEIEYLRSRRLMERVVKALQLNLSYYGVGSIREQNIYRSSPVALQILQLTDSAASFTFHIEFNDDRRFRINEGATTYALGQEFKNGYGVFKLVPVVPGNHKPLPGCRRAEPIDAGIQRSNGRRPEHYHEPDACVYQ